VGDVRDRPEGEVLASLAAAIGGEPALIARGRAIAARERRYGPAAFAPCRALLEARYGNMEDYALLRALSEEIRAGIFDAPAASRAWLLRVLEAVTLQKLRESNPELLAANGID